MARMHLIPAVNGRDHEFNATGTDLIGSLTLPLEQDVEPQAKSELYPTGGYLSELSEEYRVEGVLSFARAYSQTAGNLSNKDGHGWSTITTTVLEGLNILEVVTADRVVGQIITEHPLEGYVPEVTFLGTRFENLRIAGFPVEITLDLNMVGEKPSEDQGYLECKPFRERVEKQYSNILKSKNLSEKLRNKYNRLSEDLKIKKKTIECTLVTHVSGDFPGTVNGNVITIPGFGTVELAKLVIVEEDFKKNGDEEIPQKTTFTLTMMDFQFGCPIEGNLAAAVSTANGKTVP